nr:transposase domain-containing protein [Brucella anthropi]
MNNVDPLAWLSQTLTRIVQGWPVTEIEALMPWNFKQDVIG